MMPEMISKVAHIYAGRQLSAGERFYADAAFVPALIGLGRAEPAPIESQAGEYQTRNVAAADPAVYPTRDLAAADPAPYQRREMPATPRQKRKYARRQSA